MLTMSCPTRDVLSVNTITNCDKSNLADELSEIFQQVQPLTTVDDVTGCEDTLTENLTFRKSELQNYNIFDYLEEACLKELCNDYTSLLNVGSNSLVLGNESVKTVPALNDAREPCATNFSKTPENNKERINENPYPVVDELDSLVDDNVLSSDFFVEAILGEPEESVLNSADTIIFPKPVESHENSAKNSKLQSYYDNVRSLCEDVPAADGATNIILEDELVNIVPLTEPVTNDDNCLSNRVTDEVLLTGNVTFNLENVKKKTRKKRSSKSLDKPVLPVILPGLTEFGCTFCHPKRFFVSQVVLSTHEKDHRCPHCKKLFFDHLLNEHLQICQSKQKSASDANSIKYKCKDCDSIFPRVKTLKCHARSHVKKKCPVCDKEVQKRYLNNHARSHVKKKCPVCDKEVQKSSLKTHLELHEQSRKFICEYCGLNFVSKIKLTEHLSIHNIKPYTCKFCDREFSSRSSFWLHSRSHKTMLPYKCVSCAQSFRHSSQLTAHRQKCSANLTFKNHLDSLILPLDSNNFSSNFKVLNTFCHDRIKTENYPEIVTPKVSTDFKVLISKVPKKENKCEFCAKKFRTITSLNIHRRKHTKEKPFKCERCFKDFPSQNSLTKHLKGVRACVSSRSKNLLKLSTVPYEAPVVKILPIVKISPSLESLKTHLLSKIVNNL